MPWDDNILSCIYYCFVPVSSIKCKRQYVVLNAFDIVKEVGKSGKGGQTFQSSQETQGSDLRVCASSKEKHEYDSR